MKVMFTLIMLIAWTVVFVAATALTAPAQLPSPDRTRNDAEQDLEERIAALRYLSTLAEKGASRKVDPQLALEQLQQDFTRLQIINKDLVLTTSKAETVDLKFVAKSASEINKRAERLLANLNLPDPGPSAAPRQPETISDTNQLKKSITALGWKIYRFTKSPMFKEAGVVDASPAQKARRDLDDIMELSSAIKKACEQLNKTAGKLR